MRIANLTKERDRFENELKHQGDTLDLQIRELQFQLKQERADHK